VFNTVRTVCRSVNQIFSIINAAIFPDLQFEYGRGNLPLVQKLFRIAVDFSIIIGFIGSCTLCVIGLNLYNWWTQNALPVDKTVWNIFMIGVFMNAVWWTSVISYRMTNQPKHFAIASTSMACFSVLVCYTTSKVWGFNGAALATTLFETIMAIYILPDSCKLLRMKVTNLFKFQDDYHILLGKIKQHN
jgi:O-antigen/teichoic acid export membrane protein